MATSSETFMVSLPGLSAASIAPQLPARKIRPLAHGLEFLPPHGVVHLCAVERLRGEAAIGSGHDILAAHELGEANDALGDQLGMFDNIAGVGNHARTQHLARSNLYALEQVVLVLVTRIRRLEAEGSGVDLKDVLDDVGQGGLV